MLCKIFQFLLGIFSQVLNVIAEALGLVATAVVDVLSEVVGAVSEGLLSSPLGIAVVGVGALVLFRFLFPSGDEEKRKSRTGFKEVVNA